MLWRVNLSHYLSEIAEAGFDKIILKPCVSGGSRNTLVLDKTTAFEDKERVLKLVSEWGVSFSH